MKKLIVFLIRKRLKLRKFEYFRFTNQKTDAMYFFSSDKLWKMINGNLEESGVSLNWLLNDDCELKRIEKGGFL